MIYAERTSLRVLKWDHAETGHRLVCLSLRSFSPLGNFNWQVKRGKATVLYNFREHYYNKQHLPNKLSKTSLFDHTFECAVVCVETIAV